MNIIAENAPSRQVDGSQTQQNQELTPQLFIQIAARLQAQERRKRDALPVISRAKTTAKGGL